ncbi:MAG: rod shape-determining protein RodA [Blastomonas sp.]
MGFIPQPIASLPWRVILLLTAIAGFGAIVLYSAAGGSLSPWAGLHMLRFSVFLVMALILARIPEDMIKMLIFPGYLATLLLLIGVEAMGQIGGGSQRWLELGFLQLQPSELMKPAIVLAIARFYDLVPAGEMRSWRAIWPALLMIGLPVGLVMLQPDLGTAIAIGVGGVTVMFVSGLPMRLFAGGGIAAAIAAPMAYFFVLEDYQRRRVTTFINPENDPLGAGYHITQSQIAIGSGGITGKGFLNGSQSHLDYLPEGHTDFVFATMAEEWGLIGGLALLFAFFLLLRWGLTTGLNSPSRFGKLAGIGLTITIFFYIAINLMMVMGLAPVVGIPLPFMSHGGSSMMTVMICIGLLMGIEYRSRGPDGRLR